MDVKLAKSCDEIERCFPLMQQLRPEVPREEFVARVRRQQEAGYLLAYCEDGTGPVSVAGFRIGENLAWGRFLYVDDLVTLASARSQGYGGTLLGWLKDYAKHHHCAQLHLDSGLQRKAAHRFYEREQLLVAGYHFAYAL